MPTLIKVYPGVAVSVLYPVNGLFWVEILSNCTET